ncbi:DUF6082 family protein [Streptomyces lydicus]|uniref:DUF6082 family protein n=1 Tax=Streptomyces lydicus TaxID=47763 RepID=UPI00367715DC
MKITNAAILAVATVGALHLVQRERHQRQQNEVAVSRIQDSWLTHLTTNPDLAKLWAPDMDPEEYVQILHANQQICALSLRYKLGQIGVDKLRFLASELMSREICRRYWAKYGEFRLREAAGNKRAETFNGILQDEYVARPETQPVGV